MQNNMSYKTAVAGAAASVILPIAVTKAMDLYFNSTAQINQATQIALEDSIAIITDPNGHTEYREGEDLPHIPTTPAGMVRIYTSPDGTPALPGGRSEGLMLDVRNDTLPLRAMVHVGVDRNPQYDPILQAIDGTVTINLTNHEVLDNLPQDVSLYYVFRGTSPTGHVQTQRLVPGDSATWSYTLPFSVDSGVAYTDVGLVEVIAVNDFDRANLYKDVGPSQIINFQDLGKLALKYGLWGVNMPEDLDFDNQVTLKDALKQAELWLEQRIKEYLH